jgi:hypothetical protein
VSSESEGEKNPLVGTILLAGFCTGAISVLESTEIAGIKAKIAILILIIFFSLVWFASDNPENQYS